MKGEHNPPVLVLVRDKESERRLCLFLELGLVTFLAELAFNCFLIPSSLTLSKSIFLHSSLTSVSPVEVDDGSGLVDDASILGIVGE